jgi:hypothetical protein
MFEPFQSLTENEIIWQLGVFCFRRRDTCVRRSLARRARASPERMQMAILRSTTVAVADESREMRRIATRGVVAGASLTPPRVAIIVSLLRRP